MAPNVLPENSNYSRKDASCFSSSSSCATYRLPASSSSISSFSSAAPDPRTSSVSSPPHEPTSSGLTKSSVHYAAAYPTPMEAYAPSTNASKSFSVLAPASSDITPGNNHRPKSLPPGRNSRTSAGAGVKLHHQPARHVSGSGGHVSGNGSSSGVSLSARESAAASLSCPTPSSPTLPQHYLIGKTVAPLQQRNPPPPSAPSIASPTLAANSPCAPVAAHTLSGPLHTPVIILHSKPYGLFGPLPKSLLREGHKQRIAGVDVLRLSDSTIIPRIENSSLQQMLQADPSIFATLEAALTDCVIFLYNEGIKPFAGEIAHQMRKRIEGGSWLPSEVVALAVAAKDVYPRVERRVKGEDGWVVLLKKELHPPNFDGFVDTRAREDCYTPEQWREFNRYFIEKMRMHATESAGGSSAGAAAAGQFTEGRYALAERLRAEIPMFQSMKLAHLIRMVQLASWKKLLTYRDKALVPVAACPVTAKEFAQRNCMNLRGSDKSAAALASIEQLLRALSCIVDPEPTGIFLAQLKDLVRWTTYERLDCMVLGHTKLQDLLMSEPFIRFYRLYTPEGNEHCTYVQSKKFPLPWGAVLHTKCSMLWNPEACPMDPSSEQQHFSISDAGCCWQYKAVVPLYAQQRSSMTGQKYGSSNEKKVGEPQSSTVSSATIEKSSLPSLLNGLKKPPGGLCDENGESQGLLTTADSKTAVTAQPRTKCGTSYASGNSGAGSVDDEGISREINDRNGSHSVFLWVERDILKLLDDDGCIASPLREAEPVRIPLGKQGGLSRDVALDDARRGNASPASGAPLHRGQISPTRKYRKDIMLGGAQVLVPTSQRSSSNLVAESPLSPWYPSTFLEACRDNDDSAPDTSREGFSGCTHSAAAALLHMAAASQSSLCSCGAVQREHAVPAKQLAHVKQKCHSIPALTCRKIDGEENLLFSPCAAKAAATQLPAPHSSVPRWHESDFKMQRILKQSPGLEAAAFVNKSCYLTAACISSSPYKREEENRRTPSTSSDGVLHISPPALRAGAATGLASSSEVEMEDSRTRGLCHAEKTRETN